MHRRRVHELHAPYNCFCEKTTTHRLLCLDSANSCMNWVWHGLRLHRARLVFGNGSGDAVNYSVGIATTDSRSQAHRHVFDGSHKKTLRKVFAACRFFSRSQRHGRQQLYICMTFVAVTESSKRCHYQSRPIMYCFAAYS